MDDDIIEYYFDNIDSFYAELDDVLNRPYSTEQDVQRITTQYIRFLTRYQLDFLKGSTEFAQVAYKLIDSKICLDYSTVVLAHILDVHALNSTNEQELLVSYSLLLYAGKDDVRWMEYILLESIHLKRNRLFCKIISELEQQIYSCFKILGVAFALLFELCKLAKVEIQDLELLNVKTVNQCLDLVEETRGDHDESFNYDVIRFIMVLNEQYMMSGLNINLVMDVLSNRIGTSDTFSANLIFMLNRSNDTCVQMLILKLLYGIFTTNGLYEYFYTNDLYVLVDISLRELCDLGDTKESQTLRDGYLRVMEPLLENTQLRLHPYKKDEIHKVLLSLLNPVMQRKVNSTTKRIVKRIIENWWDKLNSFYTDNIDSPNLIHSSTLSSTIIEPKTPDIVDETCLVIPRNNNKFAAI